MASDFMSSYSLLMMSVDELKKVREDMQKLVADFKVRLAWSKRDLIRVEKLIRSKEI